MVDEDADLRVRADSQPYGKWFAAVLSQLFPLWNFERRKPDPFSEVDILHGHCHELIA